MAVLGKIRKHNVLLMCVVGFALLLFIIGLGEFNFRNQGPESQVVGEVLGEKLTYQDFMEMVDEYTEVIKMTQGRDNLNEEELNQVRDMVWNQYVQNALIANEAEKIGLRVTDDEIRDLLNEGTSPLLMQTPFVNQQTGRFDANALKQFINEYKKAQSSNPQQAEQYATIYKYWQFTEKNLRTQLLAQKYQTLLGSCFLSNKVEAKQIYNEENTESEIILASFPYSSVQDKEVNVSDDELKAKYEELKPLFKQYDETRDIKFVSVRVTASDGDRAAINTKVKEYASALASAEDPAEVVRKAGSEVEYLGVPVLKSAFPMDIQALLDSVSVGTTTDLKVNNGDNTLNVIRLISKQELPDSIEFQAIQVGGESLDAAHNRADSILNAVKADASQWEAIAKKYGQTGDKQWMTTQQYQFAPSIDADTKNYISALNTMSAGEVRNIETAMGNIILKVTNRKAMQTKYVAAVIKTKMDFTKDTYNKTYNKFSEFVAKNQNLEAIEKAAKASGYTVQETKDVFGGQHLIGNISGTHDALKWVFEAKEGEVSPLYTCGENDNLLVVVMTKIHEKGFRTLEDETVKDMVKTRVMNDKKAEKLMAKAKAIKNIADAKTQGASVDTVKQINFSKTAFIPATTASEPVINGAVYGLEKGKMSAHPLKGNAGVYVFQVTDVVNRNLPNDQNSIKQYIQQMSMQKVGNFIQELFINAKVKDNRYMFF